MLQDINKNLLIYLNSFTENETISMLVGCLADLPIFFLPVFLVTMWLCYHFKQKNNKAGKEKLLLMAYSSVFAVAINMVIQQFVDFSRPESALV